MKFHLNRMSGNCARFFWICFIKDGIIILGEMPSMVFTFWMKI